MLRPVEEVYFWSGILRDHAEFMLTALSVREQSFIRTAQYFKDTFIVFGNEAKKLMEKKEQMEAMGLVCRIEPVLLSFINFKRLILRKLLECCIEINLPPTFINHMINEAMEFERNLCMLKSGIQANPAAENIHLHEIWLPDAAGHAATIAADLDPVETELIKEADTFKKAFDNLSMKARELGLMLERACLADGSLQRLNEEAAAKMKEFMCFLEKIYILRKQCKALGIIKPLMADHMMREEKYYMANLGALIHL